MRREQFKQLVVAMAKAARVADISFGRETSQDVVRRNT